MHHFRVMHRHLVIDGYNVLHHWDETASLMRQGDIETARRRLIERARSVHDHEDMRTTVIFDGKGAEAEIHQDQASSSFAWVFSPAGITADVMIEKLAMKRGKGSEVTVVSKDSLVAASVRSSGAFLMSPDEFLNASDRAGRSFSQYASDDSGGLGRISFDEDARGKRS